MRWFPRALEKVVVDAARAFPAVVVGLEVDFIVPRGNGRVVLIEVKAARTAVPEDADNLKKLEGPQVAERWVVYQGPRLLSLGPGVRAIPVQQLAAALTQQT